MQHPERAHDKIAWFGGSFSPPTKMHVRVAVEIGKSLLHLTAPGRTCCVCIVPVSGAYKKGSVRDPCVTQAHRWTLAEAFLQAILHEVAIDPPARRRDLQFRLLRHEFDSATPVATIDGLRMLEAHAFCDEHTQIYIAQGQDNIMDIMSRRWVQSDVLLRKYRFFLFPRDNHLSTPTIVVDVVRNLIEHRDREKYPPFDLDEALDIASRIELVGDGFSDDTSSSKARQILRNNRSLDGVDASIPVHPIVLRTLLELSQHTPDIYSSPQCEVTPTTGGASSCNRRGRTSPTRRRSMVGAGVSPRPAPRR